MSKKNVNIPLLRKVVEWAEAEWEKRERGEFCEWDQNDWYTIPQWAAVRQDLPVTACGTAMCIAGYVAYNADPYLRANVDRNGAWSNAQGKHACQIAQEELGLTDEQAEVLFRASNTIEMVREIAEEIAGEPL